MDMFDAKIMKWLMYALSTMFAISGFLILLIGSILLNEVSHFGAFLQGKILTIPIILIVLGHIVFVIALVGGCGTRKKNSKLLIGFSIAITIIVIMEIAIGMTAWIHQNAMSVELRKTLKKSLDEYATKPVNRIAWDHMQTKLTCCGVDSWYDWVMSQNKELIPQTCCGNIGGKRCDINLIDIHPQGCLSKLDEVIKTDGVLMLTIGIIVICIEIASVVLSCCLASVISNDDYYK